jgi:hypothetical protein
VPSVDPIGRLANLPPFHSVKLTPFDLVVVQVPSFLPFQTTAGQSLFPRSSVSWARCHLLFFPPPLTFLASAPPVRRSRHAIEATPKSFKISST